MRFVKLSTLLSAALLSVSAQAYQFEGGVYDRGGTIERDNSDVESDLESTTFVGTVYFKNVDNSKGPWAEAVFLNKASGISFVYQDFSNKESEIDFKYSSHTAGVAVLGVIGSYLTLKAVIIEEKGKNSDSQKLDESTIKIAAGSYIGERHRIMASYTQTESTYKFVGFPDRDEIETEFSVKYKNVLQLGSVQHLSVIASVAISSVDDDENTIASDVEAGIIYYPIKNLGLKAISEFSVRDDDSDNDATTSTLEFGVSYFPIESLSLDVTYTTAETKIDNSDDEEIAVIGLGINFRI